MKNEFKTRQLVLKAAVGACFGVAAGYAMAAPINLSSSPTALKFASELTTPAVLTNASNAMSFSLNSVSGLNLASTPASLRFDLTGGAVFTTDPTITCSAYAVGDQNSAAITIVGSKIVGGAAGSAVTFTVTTAAAYTAATASSVVTTASPAPTISMTGQCTVSGFGGISASDQTSKGVSAKLSYVIAGVTTDDTRAAATIVTFSKAVSASVSAPGTAVQIDGTQSFKKFVSGSNLTTTTALIGTVNFASVGTVLTAAGVTAIPSDIGTASIITVTGASLAAAATGGVYLVTAGDTCTGGTVVTGSSAVGSSVTFSALAITNVSAGLNICLSVPGTAAISESQVTTSLSVGSNTGYTPNVSGGSGNVANLTNNGQTRNAYFVNAAASTSKTTVLRVVNKSGQTGTLQGTLYAEDGSVLGTVNTTLGTWTSTGQQMISLTSADIETKFGTSLAATAKASLKLFSPVGNIEVLNFSKDIASGQLYLVNTSTTSSN